MPTLTQYTPHDLIPAVRKIGNAQARFLKQKYFPFNQSTGMSQSQFVAFGKMTDTVKVTIFRKDGEGAVVLDHLAGTEVNFKVPKIRVKKVFTEANARETNPALATYMAQMTDLNTHLAEKVAMEAARLGMNIQDTWELMCAEALALGKCTMYYEDGTYAELDFGYTTGTGDSYNVQPDLTGDNLWTSALSNPIDTLDTLAAQIQERCTYEGEFDVLCPFPVARALRSNPEIKDALDRNKKYGNNSSMDRRQASRFMGNIDGYNFYRYQKGYSLAGVWTQMWPAGKIALVPSEPPEGWFEWHHAACWDQPTPGSDAQLIITDYFSKINTDGDPPVNELIVETRGCPLVKNAACVRVQKVI
jgi:hypothetical protein